MIIHHAKQTLIKENSTVHVVYIRALCDYILTTMQQGLGVKCVHNRWAYATYTYARNRAKSAQKRGVGLHYVMCVHYVFYGTCELP